MVGRWWSCSLVSAFLLLQRTLISSGNFFDVPLDGGDRFHLYWSADEMTNQVTMEVRANLSHPSDWLAIGFSDRGLLSNADLGLLWFDHSGETHFQDAWSDKDGVVFVDDHQDYTLLGAKRDGQRSLIFGFRRKLDTCDKQDYYIQEGTVYVIYASGPGPLQSASGLALALSLQHGFQRTRLLKNTAAEPPLGPDVQTIVISHSQVHVPAVETTYWCSLHKLPDLFKKKHHIVKYEHAVQKGHEALVHHMECFHCRVSSDLELPPWNGPCDHPNKPEVLENRCKKVLAAWAMGAAPLAYPAEAGLPIGGANFSLYVSLEMHYNNPEKIAGLVDSSGIKLYYTSALRSKDSGILELGLEYSDKNSIPPRQPHFQTSGFCTSECTRAGLPVEGIVIFAIQPHTHLVGAVVWSTLVRNGTSLIELNRDEHFSTHFQDIRLLKKRARILPGDAIINTCIYDTSERQKMTVGGLAIRQEMCVSYAHYFPRTDLEVCKSSVDGNALQGFFRYSREVLKQPTSQEKSFADNFDTMDWSEPNHVLLLRHLYDSGPLSVQCNRSNGDRFPGSWNGNSPTVVLFPLEKPTRNCSLEDARDGQN